MSAPAPGRFVWYDVMTTDPRGAVDFYSALFGWVFEDTDPGGDAAYKMFRSGEEGIGGLVPQASGSGIPAHWIPYVSVDDVDATVTRAEALGGGTMVPGTDIPGVGRFAVVRDPHGACFSPFSYTGVEMPEPESPPPFGHFCWNELLTTEPADAAAFYSGLLGWEVQEHGQGDAGTYRVFKRGEAWAAGMLQMPPDAESPPHWLSHVHVEDVDATAAKVIELGGKLWLAPKDIPNAGRMAVAADPQGATFAVYAR